MRRVTKTASCWIWQGSITPAGYGQIEQKVDGKRKNRPVHRVVYEHLVGPIPVGFDLHHECTNRRCVNPDHLEPVEHVEHALEHMPRTAECQRCGSSNWKLRSEGKRRYCGDCSSRKQKARWASRKPSVAHEDTP